MKFTILAAFLMLVSITLFTQGKYGPGLLGVALAVLAFLRGRKGKAGKPTPPRSERPAPAAAPAPAPAPAPAAPQPSPFEARKAAAGTLHFKIAGVTFEGRQGILKKIDDMEDDKYIGCTYGIERTEYEGSPAVKVYAELADDDFTQKVLGYVPRDWVQHALKVYDNVFYVDVDVYGGQDDKSYGAAATLYYDR